MKFDAAIHTKAFLLSHPDIALELAERSNEFSVSPLTQDLDVLRLSNGHVTVAYMLAWHQSQWMESEAAQNHDVLRISNNTGKTVAHTLATVQTHWLNSEASKDFDVLRLTDGYGTSVAHTLAEFQPQWLGSEAAQNYDVLRISNKIGITVAHTLASTQTHWLNSKASRDFDVLRLADGYGTSVAHTLAHLQPQWLRSEEAQNFEILRLATKQGLTVAHSLVFQTDWLNSEAVQNFEVLQLTSNHGLTVAFWLAKNQPNSIHLESLFHKKILCVEYEGQILAEFISQKYGKTQGLDTATMAMKLIEQGAAYKHSTPMAIKVGETLIKQSKLVLDDGYEPIIGLKQLQALYSTCAHNVTKILSSEEQKSLSKWNDILGKAENLLRQHLNTHPELFSIPHTVDKFCEPGDELLKKIASERVFDSNFKFVQQVEHHEKAPEQGLY
jgi:hypothetical protein